MKRLRDTAEISYSDLRALFSCSICKEIMKEPVILKKCLHRYCGSCISNWYNSSPYKKLKCPICQKPLASRRDWARDSIFSQLVASISASIPEQRDLMVNPIDAAEMHRLRVAKIKAAAETKRKELRDNPPPPLQDVVKKQYRANKKPRKRNILHDGAGESAQHLDDDDEPDIVFVNIGMKHMAKVTCLPAVSASCLFDCQFVCTGKSPWPYSRPSEENSSLSPAGATVPVRTLRLLAAPLAAVHRHGHEPCAPRQHQLPSREVFLR